MNRYLSLALSETTPGTGKFNLIAMDMDRYELVPLSLQKSEIITPGGEIFWDLGRMTAVGKSDKCTEKRTDPRNVSVKPQECHLLPDSVNLRGLLEENLSDATQFFMDHSPENRFAIVKASKVVEIRSGHSKYDGTLKCRMKLQLKGLNETSQLLNKDYRWVKYWQWHDENGTLENQEEISSRYCRLLNDGKKNVYLILYRHFFTKGDMVWIAGIHWL